MNFDEKIKKINNKLVILCFFLAMFSISVTLIDVKIARISFFIACYISLIGILIDKDNYKKYITAIPIPLLLLGISKIIWFHYFYNSSSEIKLNTNYIQSGKRVVFCSLLIAYVLVKLKMTSFNKRMIGLSLVLSFIFSTIFAIYQINIGLPRVELNTQATGAAYMYSCISLLLICYILNLKSVNKNLAYLILFSIFFISLCIIFKTGTRTAIILHPIFFITLFFYTANSKLKVLTSLLTIGMIIIFGSLFQSTIIKKIEQTNREITVYENTNGNQLSSLGARLAMWNTGVESFYKHPFGTSIEERYNTIKSYTEKNNRDRSALIYANVHLHNEIIDTLSLQGIFGAIIVILFYISMLIKAFREKNPMLLMVMMCLIGYGLTEVMFISREMTVLFSLMVFTALFFNKKEDTNTNIVKK